jgi:coenzyme F420-dependent glucose-6-phosphate dehydrogenase
VVRIGYKLCSEERTALELVEDARGAEAAGFDFAAISDHFHPWTDAQGESPFVWGALGGIATATERIEVGTAVTCPTVRIHPAIVAQAAATAAAMLPGRFFLGVGTGENLNEHILWEGWPSASRRRDMLEEAVALIRELWSGQLVTFEGDFYSVDNARLYSLPDAPPPIYVAAGGARSAELAAQIGDGLMSTSPDVELVRRFRELGGDGPRLAEIAVCVDDEPERALRTAHERWPLVGIPGELGAELPLPRHFEQAASKVTPDDIRGSVVLGADPEPFLERIREFIDAGFDDVFLHQIGTDQERFFRFAEQELLPRVRDELGRAA